MNFIHIAYIKSIQANRFLAEDVAASGERLTRVLEVRDLGGPDVDSVDVGSKHALVFIKASRDAESSCEFFGGRYLAAGYGDDVRVVHEGEVRRDLL